MNKAFFSVIFFLAAILFACNNTDAEEKKKTTAEQLVGEWNNIYLKVEVRSARNLPDSSEGLEVNRAEWESKLAIRPIRTFFSADSTWHSAHYNLKDSLVYDPSGKWWMVGDSLVMQQELPFPETTSYLLVLKGDTASFRGMLDWDTDGKKDDIYFGEQIRKSK